MWFCIINDKLIILLVFYYHRYLHFCIGCSNKFIFLFLLVFSLFVFVAYCIIVSIFNSFNKISIIIHYNWQLIQLFILLVFIFKILIFLLAIKFLIVSLSLINFSIMMTPTSLDTCGDTLNSSYKHSTLRFIMFA